MIITSFTFSAKRSSLQDTIEQLTLLYNLPGQDDTSNYPQSIASGNPLFSKPCRYRCFWFMLLTHAACQITQFAMVAFGTSETSKLSSRISTCKGENAGSNCVLAHRTSGIGQFMPDRLRLLLRPFELTSTSPHFNTKQQTEEEFGYPLGHISFHDAPWFRSSSHWGSCRCSNTLPPSQELSASWHPMPLQKQFQTEFHEASIHKECSTVTRTAGYRKCAKNGPKNGGWM